MPNVTQDTLSSSVPANSAMSTVGDSHTTLLRTIDPDDVELFSRREFVPMDPSHQLRDDPNDPWMTKADWAQLRSAHDDLLRVTKRGTRATGRSNDAIKQIVRGFKTYGDKEREHGSASLGRVLELTTASTRDVRARAAEMREKQRERVRPRRAHKAIVNQDIANKRAAMDNEDVNMDDGDTTITA